ncbi:MAG: Crp/Fnr family transcriptional regulator [Oligoflexales bacterium]
MASAVEIDSIAFLKYLPADSIAELRSRFSVLELPANTIFIRSGETVDFLYLVISGQVEVYTDILCTDHLSTLFSGDTIGEMSLVEDKRSSSATLKSSSQGAKLGMIPFLDIRKYVLDRPDRASGFYRGISELLSQRLRETNKKAKANLSIGIKVISEILGEPFVNRVLKSDDPPKIDADSMEKLLNFIPSLDNAIENPPVRIESALLSSIKFEVGRTPSLGGESLKQVFKNLRVVAEFLKNIERAMSRKTLKPIGE